MKFLQSVTLGVLCSAAMWLGVGCASAVQENEMFEICSQAEIQSIMESGFDAASGVALQPGKVYLSGDFARVFVLKRLESDLNEDGLLVARVFSGTRDEDFWVWNFSGIKPYYLQFRFLWFDADGKPVTQQKQAVPAFRSSLPGDPIRFSALAPSEACKLFSFCVETLDSEPSPETRCDTFGSCSLPANQGK